VDIKQLNLNSVEFWKKADALTKDMETNPDLRKAFESDIIGVMRKYKLDMDVPISADGKKTDKLLNLLAKNPDAQKTVRISLTPAPQRSREDVKQIAGLAEAEKSTKEFAARISALQNDMAKDSALHARFQSDLVSVLKERGINMVLSDGRTTLIDRLDPLKNDKTVLQIITDIFERPDFNEIGNKGLVAAIVTNVVYAANWVF